MREPGTREKGLKDDPTVMTKPGEDDDCQPAKWVLYLVPHHSLIAFMQLLLHRQRSDKLRACMHACMCKCMRACMCGSVPAAAVIRHNGDRDH